METKRLVLATALTFVIVFIFMILRAWDVQRNPEKYAVTTPTPTVSSDDPREPRPTPALSEAAPDEIRPVTGDSPREDGTGETTPPSQSELIASNAASGERHVTTTDLAQFVIDATGGNLRSVRLIEYDEHVPDPEELGRSLQGNLDNEQRRVINRNLEAIENYLAEVETAEAALARAVDSGNQQAIDEAQRNLKLARALELVPFLESDQDQPLTTYVRFKEEEIRDSQLVYETAGFVDNGTAVSITFTADAGELEVNKKYILNKDSYRGDLHITVTNNGAERLPRNFGEIEVAWEGGIGRFLSVGYRLDHVLYQYGAKFSSPVKIAKAIEAGDFDRERTPKMSLIQSKYFLAGLVPESRTVFQPHFLTVKMADEFETGQLPPPMGLRYDIAPLAPGESQTERFLLYLGPKKMDPLEKIPGIQPLEIVYQKTYLLDWIHMTWICPFILACLEFFHGFTGNYGFAIILLVLVVKIVLYPLTLHQHTMQRKMRTIQPQIKAIQEKYKQNPMDGQKKVHDLMRKNNVKMSGGCLPVLLQMPIFLGLYFTLYYGIELRGAPFFGWITDLSEPDSLFPIALGGSVFHLRVLPLLNAGITFLTMQQTPVADPKQKQIFAMMPLIMLFIFWQFPSGLVLYWTVQSLVQFITVLLMEHVHFRHEKGDSQHAG